MVITPSPALGYEGMKRHESQLVWFRRLFVVFSSYMYVNQFSAMKNKISSLIGSVNEIEKSTKKKDL